MMSDGPRGFWSTDDPRGNRSFIFCAIVARQYDNASPVNGRFRNMLRTQCGKVTGGFPPSTSMDRFMLQGACGSATG